MKFYLSSFRIGAHAAKLAEFSEGGPLAYIPNALDHAPLKDQSNINERNKKDLNEVGISYELFDLRDFSLIDLS